MISSPGGVYEFAVGGSADQNGVAVCEFLVSFIEFSDLCRANKSKVFGHQNITIHLPLFLISS
jgi:hypothetical protein